MSVDPTERRLARIKEWIMKGLVQGYLVLDEMESLNGKLVNVAATAWPGQAFVIVPVVDWVRKDFMWWLHYINLECKIDILEMFEYEPAQFSLWTDGATN
eukprot:716303_1